MENYDNSIYEGLLETETLPKLRFGSSQKEKHYEQQRYLQSTKEIWNGLVGKGKSHYNDQL